MAVAFGVAELSSALKALDAEAQSSDIGAATPKEERHAEKN
jgi:hypothetical protein